MSTGGPSYDTGFKPLAPGMFETVLKRELERAVRARNSLTLVILEASREAEGAVSAVDDDTMVHIAEIVGRTVRETDVIGQTGNGTVSVALLDTDSGMSTRVIDRVISRMRKGQMPPALHVAVGAACYPTDAIDADALKRQALSHRVTDWSGAQ